MRSSRLLALEVSFNPVLAREKVPVHFQLFGSTAWFMIYLNSPETVQAGEWLTVQESHILCDLPRKASSHAFY